MTDPRRCYSCQKEATLQIESVGRSHHMVIWVCDDHYEPGAKIVTKIKGGIRLARREKTEEEE